jgi:hypothetical protein
MNTEQTLPKQQSFFRMGFLLYFGYLAIFFATWAINGVDYLRIGESAETTKLWYALPTLLGCAFLVIAITALGWWRLVLFDKTKSGPLWVWILPIAITGIIVVNFAGLNTSKLSPEVLLWSTLGAVGVGFGEEVITRGGMVVGLRSRFPEIKVWLFSTLLFSALHVPNVIFGLPLEAMPIQLLLTFIFGSGMYIIRRTSGTLILPMVLHGLWDSSLFLSNTTGVEPTVAQWGIYPLAIVCAIAVLLKNRKPNDEARNA